MGRFEVALPAVLGIQAAEKPPRYVPVAKVRAAIKTAGDRDGGGHHGGRRRRRSWK